MLVAAWLAVVGVFAGVCTLLARPGLIPSPNASPWRTILDRITRDRLALVGLAFLVTLYFAAAIAPWIAPYEYRVQLDIVELKHQAPTLAHPFGTDQYSRDVLSRVLHGARVSLSVALLSVLLAISIGTAYGGIAGFAGGRLDGIMMRLIDALLALPRILILIAVLALWGGVSLPALVILLGLTGWFGVSRLVRAQVLATRGQDFVVAARALGASPLRLFLRHVLPQAMSPVIVAATLGVGNVIMLEAGLSYLGIGVPQPRPSWGNIIQDGAEYISTQWWVTLFPGLAIVLTVMAFNVVGDALRDAMDPRQVDGR
ncbi:MAG TPA: ABC transporter permease [Gemmatimonadaceae bacterium]|nr:ABC transporter permease [Gemmatimonadaceae bacterium]